MPDLLANFDVFRGDLLYGQARDRGAVLKYIYANHTNGWFYEEAMDAGAWITVDNLNAPLEIGPANYARPPDETDALMGQAAGAAKQRIKALKGDKTDQGRLDLAKAYKGLMDDYRQSLAARDNRFSPVKVRDAAPDKLEREGWDDLGDNQYYLAIRRACKFGIQYVTQQIAEARIHFMLNRFDQGTGWVDLLWKEEVPTPRRTKPTMIITYSELRYIYKNRDTFGPRVDFYRYEGTQDNVTSCPECPAPWDDSSRTVTYQETASTGVGTVSVTKSHKDLWADSYSPAKFAYYKALLLKVAATKSNYVKGLADDTISGAESFVPSYYDQAIADVKYALKQIRSGAWK